MIMMMMYDANLQEAEVNLCQSVGDRLGGRNSLSYRQSTSTDQRLPSDVNWGNFRPRTFRYWMARLDMAYENAQNLRYHTTRRQVGFSFIDFIYF